MNTVCIFKRAIIIKRCLPVLELDDGGGGGTRQHATCNLGSEFREHRYRYKYSSTKVLPVTGTNTEETYSRESYRTTVVESTGTTTFAHRKHRYLVLAERSIVTFALITLESYQSNKKFMKSNSILQKEEPINTLYTMNRWCCCILASMYVMLVVLPTIILSRYQNSKCETACVCVESVSNKWSTAMVIYSSS